MKTYLKPELKTIFNNTRFDLMAASQSNWTEGVDDEIDNEIKNENKRWRNVWGDYQ